jgi:hypothetical protein
MIPETMVKKQICRKIETLPLEGLMELLNWLTAQLAQKVTKKRRVRGRAKGLIIMHADFDEPLDDFKEYMPC